MGCGELDLRHDHTGGAHAFLQPGAAPNTDLTVAQANPRGDFSAGGLGAQHLFDHEPVSWHG